MLDEASHLPSGLNATDVTASVCPLSIARGFPLARSQRRMVLFLLPDETTLSSGENATHRTALAWPLKDDCLFPLATSQSMTRRSEAPEASVLSSRLKRIAEWPRPCPSNDHAREGTP